MAFVVRHGPHGGVLWVDGVRDGQTVSLGGYCRYWLVGDAIGGTGCPDHPHIGRVSYRWDGRWVKGTEHPPQDVVLLHGEWLPDDVWRKVRR